MNNAMLQQLKNLYVNPVFAWKEIDKITFHDKWLVVKNNLFFFLITNPLIFFLSNLVQFESLTKLVFRGILFPLLFTGFGILILIVISLLVEEIYKLISFKDPQQNIFKLLVYSSLPFFSLSGMMDIPFLGTPLFLTGIFYSGYLLKTGIDKFLWVNKSSRRQIFLISSFVSALVVIIMILIFYMITGVLSSSITRLFN